MLQAKGKIPRKEILLIVSWSVFLLCASFTAAHGQTLKTRITVSSSSPALVRIDAESIKPVQSWSFRNAYAGVLGLGVRIEHLDAVGDRGETVPVRKIAAGEFRSTVRGAKFGY